MYRCWNCDKAEPCDIRVQLDEFSERLVDDLADADFLFSGQLLDLMIYIFVKPYCSRNAPRPCQGGVRASGKEGISVLFGLGPFSS